MDQKCNWGGIWTHQYHLKMFMVQQLHTVLQVIKFEQLNNARDNLLIGSKPKPKPSAPLKRPPPSVVRYPNLHWITSQPSPSGHLGPSGDQTPVILAPDGTAPLAETWPPGTCQLGSSHLPPLCYREYKLVLTDNLIAGDVSLPSVCVLQDERLTDVSSWDG